MLSFLRPLITVLVLTAIHIGAVIWCAMGNWSYVMDAADADDIERDPGIYQTLCDLLYFPTSLLSESAHEQLVMVDYVAMSLMFGFVGWMGLVSLGTFLKKPEKGEPRSLLPSISFGNLICLAMFGLLVFGWVTQRLMLII